MKCDIAIIVRYRNETEQMVKQLADTLYLQTDKNFKVYLLDNNTQPQSGKWILKDMLQDLPGGVVYTHDNRSVNRALYFLLSEIQLETPNAFVLMIDVDDVVSPNYVEAFREAIETSEHPKATIFFSPMEHRGLDIPAFVNPKVHPLIQMYTMQMCEGLVTKCYPIKLLLDNYIINDNPYDDDFVINTQIFYKHLGCGKLYFKGVDKAKYYYLVTDTSLSNAKFKGLEDLMIRCNSLNAGPQNIIAKSDLLCDLYAIHYTKGMLHLLSISESRPLFQGMVQQRIISRYFQPNIKEKFKKFFDFDNELSRKIYENI